MAHINGSIFTDGTNLQDQFSPSNIDALVASEMAQLKANYAYDAQKYVEQMLIDNPVVMERRKSNNATIGSSSDTNSQHTSSSSLQQKRSDSCRRSRINNKIKKTKMRFHHKFILQKMEQRSQVMKCINDVIRQVEGQLISIGYTELNLLRMKYQLGVKEYSPVRSVSAEQPEQN